MLDRFEINCITALFGSLIWELAQFIWNLSTDTAWLWDKFKKILLVDINTIGIRNFQVGLSLRKQIAW